MAFSTGRRVIGRILSLGFPLPGQRVDNYNFLTAPSFFDYDALVVAPSALGALIEDVCDGAEVSTFSGLLVVNGEAGRGAAALRDALRRRRAETEALLGNGGTVVCFATPAADHSRISGDAPVDDYFWLPDTVACCCRAPILLPADGTLVDVVDFEHPLAAFVQSQAAHTAYCARFEDTALRGGRVFVRSRGGAAVGVELPSDAGRVVMLPSLGSVPSGEPRYALSDALQDGIRRLIGVAGEGREPPWVADYEMPGLAERTASLVAAQQAKANADRAVAEAEARFEEVAGFRRLLWQEGVAGLGDVVLDALRLIGFEVRETDAESCEIWYRGEGALLEIESSERPIDLAPHYRLRQRIERALERRSVAPRGVLIVNGRRSTPPPDRDDEVTPAMRAASETMRYCVAPSHTLFTAVVAHLEGRTEDVSAYRVALLRHNGVLAPEKDA